MTESTSPVQGQGEGVVPLPYYLDLEMMERDDAALEFVAELARGFDPTCLTGRFATPQDPGYDQSGATFYAQFRFLGSWEVLLEVATRYVERQENPEAWETISIVNRATGEEHPVTAGQLPPGETGREIFFVTSRVVRVTLPISVDDDDHIAAVQASVNADLDRVLGEIGQRLQRRFRVLRLKVEVV